VQRVPLRNQNICVYLFIAFIFWFHVWLWLII
jgi:hypothetical protein